MAAGCGITTVPATLPVPPGIRALPVRGGPQEHRRLLLAHLPGPLPDAVRQVAGAIRGVALETSPD